MVRIWKACEKRCFGFASARSRAPAASLKLHEAHEAGLEIARSAAGWFANETATTDAASGKRQSMTETFVPRFSTRGGKLLPRGGAWTALRQDNDKWILTANYANTRNIRITAETVFVCRRRGADPSLPPPQRRHGPISAIRCAMHPTVKVVAVPRR